MHELSMAQNIVETIGQQVTEDLSKVTGIDIRIGAFSGVVADSLAFGLEIAMADHGKKDIEVNIIEVPTFALCACQHRYQMKQIFEGCPECGSFERRLVDGLDVVIQSVHLLED